jgi:Tfp pilus assembly protein PilF
MARSTSNRRFIQTDARIAQLALSLTVLLTLSYCATKRVLAQESIERLAQDAESLEQQGKLAEAAEKYQTVLKINPRSVAALNRLGTIYVHQGKFDQGIEFYRRALRLRPEEFGTNLNLGIAYMRVQDYKSAAPVLDRAAGLRPSDFQAQALAGVA